MSTNKAEKIKIVKTDFAEVVGKRYMGKVVHVYFSESAGRTKWEQFDIEEKNVVTGKVLGAQGECLFLEWTNGSGHSVEVCLNGLLIVGVTLYSKELPEIFAETWKLNRTRS